MPSKNLHSNVWKFHGYKFFSGLANGLSVPILVLFFLDRGISLAEFMLLMSTLNISVFVFEVPTGIVADTFSRTWSICLGTLWMTLAVWMMVATVNYPLLLAAFVIWGLGEALVSGADSALLYDSLKAEQRDKTFQQTIGTAISFLLSGTLLGAILCGLVVTHTGLRGPMVIAIGIRLLTVILAALFAEPPFLQSAREHAANTFEEQVSDYIAHLKGSARSVWQSRELLALIFMNVVILRLGFLTERPFAQPYLAFFGYTPQHISYFHTLFYGATALFAKYSHSITTVLGKGERRSFSMIGLLGILSLTIMVHAWTGSVVVVSMVGIYLMKGAFTPLMEDSLNRRVSSEQRASCLSIAKMGNNFLGIFLGPLFGFLADAFSLKFSLLTLQWTFVPLLIVSIILGWRILGPMAGPEPVIPENA